MAQSRGRRRKCETRQRNCHGRQSHPFCRRDAFYMAQVLDDGHVQSGTGTDSLPSLQIDHLIQNIFNLNEEMVSY